MIQAVDLIRVLEFNLCSSGDAVKESRTEKDRCVLVICPKCHITSFTRILMTKGVLMSTSCS